MKVVLTPSAGTFDPTARVTVTMTVTYSVGEFLPVIYNRLVVEGPANATSASPNTNPIVKDFRWNVNGDILTPICGLTVSLAARGGSGGYGFSNTPTQYFGRYGGYGYDANAGHGAAGYAGGNIYTGTKVPATNGGNAIPVDSDVFSGYTPTGAGYGYDGNGDLTYTVSFLASCLPNSKTYRLTGSVETDYFQFESAFSNIAIATTSSGGGGSSPKTTDTNTGPGQTQTFTAVSITPPAGALFAYRVSAVTASAGNTIIINTGDSKYPQFTLHIGTAFVAQDILFVVWPATTPPPGTTAAPSGFTMENYLSITIGGAQGTETNTVTIKVTLPSTITNPGQAGLLHFVTSAWVGESQIVLTLSGSTYTGTGTSPCCSVFAVGYDTQGPTVTLTLPTGELKDTVKFAATATDNIKVSKVEFLVDGVKKGEDTSSPYEFSFDSKSVTNGDHKVKAVAYDFVQNKAEAEKGATVANAGVSPPTTTTPGGTTASSGSMILWIVLGLIVLVVIIAAVAMAGKKPKK